MVGDVKQSIYKFRQADPTLFMDKYHRFTKDGDQSGLRIDLSKISVHVKSTRHNKLLI